VISRNTHEHAGESPDIEHALRNWLVAHELADSLDRHVTMHVGPTRAGASIEVGVNSDQDVIHAMPARRQYLPLAMRKGSST
jgi:hypothetical protein